LCVGWVLSTHFFEAKNKRLVQAQQLVSSHESAKIQLCPIGRYGSCRTARNNRLQATPKQR
jgi:hypothetical protein